MERWVKAGEPESARASEQFRGRTGRQLDGRKGGQFRKLGGWVECWVGG